MRSNQTSESTQRLAESTPLETALDMLGQFTVMSPNQRLLVGLWSAHTHCFTQFGCTPRLYFTADKPGAGKTTAMQVALAMAHEPMLCGYSSQAAIYTWLDQHPQTTFGVDEADQVYGITGRRTSRPILLAVMNDGYGAQGKVLVVRGGVAIKINCFAPLAMAGLGTLPPALLSRSIAIELQPAVPQATYLPEHHNGELAIVGMQMAEWLGKPQTRRLLATAPDLAPVTGDPRFRQIMSPLYAIATAAGVAEQFTVAAAELRESMAVKQPVDRAAQLVSDLATVWPQSAAMLRASEVIGLLRKAADGRWRSLTDDQAGARVLASLFAEREIRTAVRNGARGYLRSQVLA